MRDLLFLLLPSLLLWETSSYVSIRSSQFLDFRSRQRTRSSTSTEIPPPTTKQLTDLMVDLWKAVVHPPEDVTGKEFVLDHYSLNRNQVKGFLNHFQFCKDCALDNSFLMATQNKEGKDSLYLSYVSFPILSDDEADDENWGNFDPSLLKGKNDVDEDETDEIQAKQRTIFPVEDDNQIILHDTKLWVEKVIAQFGICPFTIDSNRAGIPLGGVRYRIARATTPEEAFLFFWEEVQLLMQVKEKEMATTLLVFPEIELFGNYELFEFYCECLNDALSASSLNLESEVQLVFFHPKYNFRDGKDRIMSGDGNKNPAETSCLNYARRSPWPMINILRSNQVKAAQKGIPTGLVYQQNDERLSKVGSEVLQDMLVHRNWKNMPIIEEGRMKLNPSDEKEKKAINLQNPILTSFSPAVKSCPFHSSTEAIPREEIQEDQKSDKMENHDRSEDRSVDYLKFADEVEKWMNEGEI